MKPVILGFVVLATAASALAQVPAQARIPQQIVINGQPAAGAYVLTASGSIQNYACQSPQAYSTPDGAAQGWACQESTGNWLLGALPPQTAAQPAPQPVVVQQPAPPPQVVYAPLPQVVAAPPQVVYVMAQQPTVIYRQPTVIYRQPAPVIYSVAPAPRTVIVNSYPSSTALEVATIQAAGRIAAAAVGRPYRTIEVIEPRGGGGHRR